MDRGSRTSRKVMEDKESVSGVQRERRDGAEDRK